MDRAKCHAEVLFVENNWSVFKDAIAQSLNFEFLDRDAFKLRIPFNFLQVTRLLELLGTALIQEVGEH